MATSTTWLVHPWLPHRVTDSIFVAVAISAADAAGCVNISLALCAIAGVARIAGVLPGSLQVCYTRGMGPVHRQRHIGNARLACRAKGRVGVTTGTEHRLGIHEICVMQAVVCGKNG